MVLILLSADLRQLCKEVQIHTLYILTVYFGAVGIKKMRYAVKVGLLADLVGIIASIIIVTIIFGIMLIK